MHPPRRAENARRNVRACFEVVADQRRRMWDTGTGVQVPPRAVLIRGPSAQMTEVEIADYPTVEQHKMAVRQMKSMAHGQRAGGRKFPSWIA